MLGDRISPQSEVMRAILSGDSPCIREGAAAPAIGIKSSSCFN